MALKLETTVNRGAPAPKAGLTWTANAQLVGGVPVLAADDADDLDRHAGLVGVLPLPGGASCARQLHLDAEKLLASLDHDPAASAFSRGAQQLAQPSPLISPDLHDLP